MSPVVLLLVSIRSQNASLMKISISGLCERDMDLFQIEELGLPKGLVIIHKVDRSFVDLQFAGWGERVPVLRTLIEAIRENDMTVECAAGADEEQINAIKEGITAAGNLHRRLWENQETLESLLRPEGSN